MGETEALPSPGREKIGNKGLFFPAFFVHGVFKNGRLSEIERD